MRDPLLRKWYIELTSAVDRRWGWHHLPKVPAMATLIGIRMKLRRENLFDVTGQTLPWQYTEPPTQRPLTRSTDGSGNDVEHPEMGSTGRPFGRNVAVSGTHPIDILEPNPRTISRELLARKEFIPATSLNIIAGAWLQFEVHDWLSHGLNLSDDQFLVELAPDDPWTHERPMRIERTRPGAPTIDGEAPTYRNTETHWWDASQLYGSTLFIEKLLRTGQGGKLKLTPESLVPLNPATFPDPPGATVNLFGAVRNWWIGLAMLHTLFMREHNAICDHLATAYPEWTDDQLFDHARLVTAALIAKIHTIEWTPALLTNPALATGMRANWWGFFGERVNRRLGRVGQREEVSGIAGSRTHQNGAPYAITEEFVAVYRMHPLIPDDYDFRSVADDRRIAEHGFDELTGARVDDVLQTVAMADLFYSLGTRHPGAITLHNYPKHLQNFVRSDNVTIDLAAYDIVRSRERGVPRYNEFRRRFHLLPFETFEEMSDDPRVRDDLRRIYGHPEKVDLMVGLYAEKLPEGFAFSDTAFRVFTLMASRRIKSDRFFTYDYRPEVYSPEGMNWINENSMSTVLLRHYPELAPALRGVKNAFTPWNTVGPHILAEEEPVALGRLSARETVTWHLRRGFWNHLMTFKFRGNKPSAVPVPVADSPITLVPLSEKFAAIPVSGLFVADRVPDDEAGGEHRVKAAFSHFQEMLTRFVPPTQPGLPPVPADPVAALDRAYTKAHRKLFPAPVRPTETTLGQLAVASPYACYLQRTPDGGFCWDLSVLRNFEVHPGLVRLGAVVDFRFDAGGGGLEATRIESELGTHVPGDPKWMAATRLAMCSVTNHTSLVRHFNWLHLTCGGPLAVVTRNRLPADHHVRRFLWPHVYGTQFSNAMVTPILMSKGGDFESVFSFTHAGLCRLFEFTTAEFDLGKINPLVDAARRGVSDLGRTAVVQQNNEALFKIFSDHARRYLSSCYDSDDALANDQEFGAWVLELGQRLPHGVGAVMADGSGLDGAGQLLATLAYMASVEHEMTGSGLWDYQLWNDVSPVRIYEHGLREPLDVSQRLVNANFNLNVHRTMLLQDFSGLAVDNVRSEAFSAFYRDLCAYQAVLDRSAPAPWRLEPNRLKANINA